MKNVYRVTYDIRLGRSRRFLDLQEARFVLANGDARAACQVLEREEKSKNYRGKPVTQVRILEVEQVATDVLV